MKLVDWRPHEDVARAELPPPAWYADESVYARSLERVFTPSWQWIASAHEIAAAPSARPVVLLPGSLDEPLALTNDGERVRCLSNVCTHRAMTVVERACSTRGLRCPYHGRRFRLDGRFESAPGFEDAVDFPRAEDDLQELPLERALGQFFTSLAPERPFDEFARPLLERVGHLPFDRAVHAPERDREFVFDAPWSMYVENYLEGLHIPYLHAGLTAAIEWDSYEHVLWGGGTWQIADAKPGEPAFDVPAGHPDHGRRVAAWYAMVFPNLMVNAYPWGVSLNLVRPLGPSRTAVRFASFVWDAALLGKGAGGDLDTVEREDEAAVVRVARGARARLARTGRYAPRHEAGMHALHRWVAERVAGGSAL
ncbi:MAG: SRPBCC family protein [Planctomycetota bacterium]